MLLLLLPIHKEGSIKVRKLHSATAIVKPNQAAGGRAGLSSEGPALNLSTAAAAAGSGQRRVLIFNLTLSKILV